MTLDADVVIVGSGPAGVSAAWPLVEAGLRVSMVDAGDGPHDGAPTGTFRTLRETDPEQWTYFLGRDYHALKHQTTPSPKLRVPSLAHVFAGFHDWYGIEPRGFAAVGSLATGGLSNAWGAGVSCLSDDEIAALGLDPPTLRESYRAVAERIGLSGSSDDDMAGFHGTDLGLQAPPELEPGARTLLAKYGSRRARKSPRVRLGRARTAVLTRDQGARKACDLSGLCVVGCARGSIYSALHDLEELRQRDNFTWRGRARVDRVLRDPGGPRVQCKSGNERFELRAPRVVLACGALGTAKLVLEQHGLHELEVPLLCTPMAAFALCLPRRLGANVEERAFGLAQLSYEVPASLFGGDDSASGNLFAAHGLRTSDLVRHMPLSRPAAVGVMKLLGPSLLLANCYLSTDYGAHHLRVRKDGALITTGEYSRELRPAARRLQRALARFFRGLGAWMLPGSFQLCAPGEDIHYAGTVPMSRSPERHQAGLDGQVAGLPGVYVADGAALPLRSCKPLTLTIMANADRVGRGIARER